MEWIQYEESEQLNIYIEFAAAIEYNAHWQLTKAAIEQSTVKHAVYMAKIGWNYTPEQVSCLLCTFFHVH